MLLSVYESHIREGLLSQSRTHRGCEGYAGFGPDVRKMLQPGSEVRKMLKPGSDVREMLQPGADVSDMSGLRAVFR